MIVEGIGSSNNAVKVKSTDDGSLHVKVVSDENPLGPFEANIANDESLSQGIDLAGLTIVAIQMPAAWTTADLTFQASIDGDTYYDAFTSAGSEYEVKAAANQYIMVSPSETVGFRYVKVRSGTSNSPVDQDDARVIKLVVRAV